MSCGWYRKSKHHSRVKLVFGEHLKSIRNCPLYNINRRNSSSISKCFFFYTMSVRLLAPEQFSHHKNPHCLCVRWNGDDNKIYLNNLSKQKRPNKRNTNFLNAENKNRINKQNHKFFDKKIRQEKYIQIKGTKEETLIHIQQTEKNWACENFDCVSLNKAFASEPLKKSDAIRAEPCPY